jgi:serine/threonine-protein kinase
MSPEQGMGEKLDGRSDIYSLGVVLYELTTGQAPYDSNTPLGVIFRHVNDPLPPPRDLNPELPESLEQIIAIAMAKKPEDRYATAGEMVAALRAADTKPALQPVTAVVPMPDAEKSGITRLVKTPSATKVDKQPPQAKHSPQRSANQWLNLAIIGVLVLIIMGIAALFGLWFFVTNNSDSMPASAPKTTEAALPTATPRPLPTNTPLPTATPTAVVLPTPLPPPTNTPPAAQPLPATQPPPAANPPQPTHPAPPANNPQPGETVPAPLPVPPAEAVNACINASEGDACRLPGPSGQTLNGTCQIPPQQSQLACIPAR